MKLSLTKEEILSIYFNALKRNAGNTRYEKSILLENAVLANMKGLFPNFGYMYHYEDCPDVIVVPVALNYLFGFDKPTNYQHAFFVTINCTRPINANGAYVINVEDLYAGEFYEIPIENFAEKFANVTFSENNIDVFLSDIADLRQE